MTTTTVNPLKAMPLAGRFHDEGLFLYDERVSSLVDVGHQEPFDPTTNEMINTLSPELALMKPYCKQAK